VAAVLRRGGGAAVSTGSGLLRYPDLEIDLARRRVTVAGEEVALSRTEWELLAQLAEHAGQTLTHDEILARVWGPEHRGMTHYLRTWIGRLRDKLDRPASPAPLTTLPGFGYRWEAPPPDPAAPEPWPRTVDANAPGDHAGP
jgi:two-component system KDP operon response regulator KdpE